MLEAVEKLQAARDLVARPQGREVDEHSPCATCFCPMAALFRVRGAVVGLGFLRQAIGARSVPVWNDAPGRTRGEVVETFDQAIALAQEAA